MSEEYITRAEFNERVDSLIQQMNALCDELRAKCATRTYVQEYVTQMVGDILPIHDPFTETSKIAGYEHLDIERTLVHFRVATEYYTIADFRSILMFYDIACREGNINPYIALAQMVKETDWGRSWWSQRPRRNPAAIGVTGETSKNKPRELNGWTEDPITHIWKKGYSFDSWNISAQAHIGHLLTYLYIQGALTTDQQRLVALDPRSNAVPASIRGTVKVLKDLDGKWAVPGIGYGRSIATLANALKR